jgi:hypothetical protein
MKTVTVTKEDIRAILTTLDRFPESDPKVTIATTEGLTPGYTLEILFNTTINGIPGVFKVDLTPSST